MRWRIFRTWRSSGRYSSPPGTSASGAPAPSQPGLGGGSSSAGGHTEGSSSLNDGDTSGSSSLHSSMQTTLTRHGPPLRPSHPFAERVLETACAVVEGRLHPTAGTRRLRGILRRRDLFYRAARWLIPFLVGVGATVAAAAMVPPVDTSSSRADYIVKVEAVAW